MRHTGVIDTEEHDAPFCIRKFNQLAGKLIRVGGQHAPVPEANFLERGSSGLCRTELVPDLLRGVEHRCTWCLTASSTAGPSPPDPGRAIRIAGPSTTAPGAAVPGARSAGPPAAARHHPKESPAMIAQTLPDDPSYCFVTACDIEDEVQQIRIVVDGMTGYIPTALVALTVTDAERLCDRLNAKLGLSRDGWTALAARSMRAETPQPGDRTAH